MDDDIAFLGGLPTSPQQRIQQRQPTSTSQPANTPLIAAGEFLQEQWEWDAVTKVEVAYGWHSYLKSWRPTVVASYPTDILVETDDRRVGVWVRKPLPDSGPYVKVTKLNGQTKVFK